MIEFLKKLLDKIGALGTVLKDYPAWLAKMKSLFDSLNTYRPWIMGVMAGAVLYWYYTTDPNHGAETTARIQWVAWLMVLVAPTYWVRKTLMPGDSKELMKADTIPAAIMWAAMAILSGLLFLAFASMARADDRPIPHNAFKYLPVLGSEVDRFWPDQNIKATLAGQVETESCVTLTSPKCWSPMAELRTSREYGFGLSAITITKKFDNFAAARGLDPSLRDWEFENRYDARKQLRALVLMDKQNSNRLDFVTDSMERIAMSLAAYNGGMGGVLSERRLCSSIPGCEPNIWFGNVELHSLKNKIKTAGYGKSFFEINREYPRNILKIRRLRYAAWFGEV